MPEPRSRQPGPTATDPAGRTTAPGWHWPEYLIEASALATFMMSACLFGVLLFHPMSPVPELIPGGGARRILMGLAMGATAAGLIYSPWGRRSGAHLNPAVTLTFLRLGRVHPRDAAGYVGAQFLGGIAGMALAATLLHRWIADPAVNYVITVPGPGGVTPALLGELIISFLLMLAVLAVAGTKRLANYTGLAAGALVAIYIAIESPLSGMSMNPARTFGSAFSSGRWTAIWIYFVAPPLAMLLAAQVYLWRRGHRGTPCAKLQHDAARPCIFCQYHRGKG